MLEKLTKKQEKLIETVREEWLNRFFSLEFDEKKAVKMMKWLYKISGLKEPEVIVCDSPMAMQKRAQKITKKTEYHYSSFYGNSDDYFWVAYYDFYERVGVVKNKLFSEYKELIKANVFMSIQLDKFCIISRPPIFIKRDEKNRLHCENDYAIFFSDNYGQHYLHGVFIEPGVFEKVKNKTITTQEIMKLKNTEQRMAILMTLGFDKMLNELDYKVIDSENTGYSKWLKKDIIDELIEFEIDGLEIRAFKFTDYSTGKQGVELVELFDESWKINTVKDALKWRCQIPLEEDFHYEKQS